MLQNNFDLKMEPGEFEGYYMATEDGYEVSPKIKTMKDMVKQNLRFKCGDIILFQFDPIR